MASAQTGKRIAFFGGSFDPPHLGHLAIARAAREGLQLDAVLFAPVGTQPLKPQGATASFDDRLAMTRLAIAGEAGFEVSLIDAPRPESVERPQYTIDALEKLRAVLPADVRLYCLVGADSFLNLRQWHRPVEILFTAEMIVASRPGEPLEKLAEALPNGLKMELTESTRQRRVYAIEDDAGRKSCFTLLPGLNVDISATAIRAQAGAVAVGTNLVPFAVAEYIRARGLYR